MMEADLKAQATTAMGLLHGISHASLPLEFIDSALRTIQETDSAIRPRVQPDNAAQRLTSSHSLAFATREVAELELSVEAAITVVSRWLDSKVDGLQGLPANTWRVQSDELVAAVANAGEMLEAAAMNWYYASGVLDVIVTCWFNHIPLNIREVWVQDARTSLASARDHLNDARASVSKACAAAARARDAGKIILDFL
ncbi:hypothetical protein CFC21_107983 [Triticum aestivum]|uniref:Uncharacterized protein n=2 Tax=Triticum aestivum TaxID=4565 RepID=A0A3B6TF80_WHEAT|nr:uncharacterized protein LOC123169432 [Triticum aestivum]KAF7107344.1 hypothetical protein CFC21_107983 [Triticum aestivum]